VVPEAKEMDFPTLLDMDPPKVSAYSIESVVAEKFQAGLDLADLNSRMKDFYDIWVLSQRYSFDGLVLQNAIMATCARRNTSIQAGARLFTQQFSDRPEKQRQWQAFVKKGSFEEVPEGFSQLMTEVRSFLLPIAESCENNVSLDLAWQPGGPWSGGLNV
jgi:predicted nucleotidyltransferase component of viral defense system